MKSFCLTCFCLLAALPAAAEVSVVDAVAKLYGQRARIEIKLSNPGYQPQEGPIVVTLRAHGNPDEPWVELKTWVFKSFPEGPQPLLLFRGPALADLAKLKKFECQLTIQVPNKDVIEQNTRLEKLEY